jgi:putative ABC transport system substrate-binding protein
MRRRDFIKTVAASAITSRFAARAQPAEQMRRIGVLMNVAADQPLGQPALAVFQQGLQQLGWSDGRDVRFDIRWGENDVDRDRKYATELVALSPDGPLALWV